MIEVCGISKSYGDVQAVNNLSFMAQAGAITTLLGANGSGKTTTLRSIAGLIKPDQGNIHLNGINVKTDAIEARRHLGIFPDQFGLYPRLTAAEHLEYFGKLHGLQGDGLNAALCNTIKTLKMEDIAERRTQGFSQGQRMKVALGRAFIHSPKVMILDEPTRGLDIFNVRLLRKLLGALRDKGVGILISCHVMSEVEGLSDQVIFIKDGEKKASGQPDDLIKDANAINLEEAFVHYAGEGDQ